MKGISLEETVKDELIKAMTDYQKTEMELRGFVQKRIGTPEKPIALTRETLERLLMLAQRALKAHYRMEELDRLLGG